MRLAAQAAMVGNAPFRGSISLAVSIYLAIPRSWSEKRRAAAIDGTIAASKKPDADNGLKCLEDAMNGVVYDDDAQIVRISLDKLYGEVPRCEVRAGVIAMAQMAP